MNGDTEASLVVKVGDGGGSSLVVVLAGSVDIVSVEALEGDVQDLLHRQANRVVIDLGDVEFIDSSGIALLLRIANHFDELSVQRPRVIVRRVIDALGLTEKLHVDPR